MESIHFLWHSTLYADLALLDLRHFSQISDSDLPALEEHSTRTVEAEPDGQEDEVEVISESLPSPVGQSPVLFPDTEM